MGLFNLFNRKRTKKELLQWQNLVMQDSPNVLIMTEQQLKEASISQAKNILRIINDSKKLIEKTLKPEVFFMRLQLIVEKSEHLCKLEPYVDFTGGSPSAAFREVERNFQLAIKQFLIRYFTDTFDKAESMASEKGKIKKYQKFYDSLQNYYWLMDDANKEYIETKYRLHAKQ